MADQLVGTLKISLDMSSLSNKNSVRQQHTHSSVLRYVFIRAGNSTYKFKCVFFQRQE